MADRDKKVYFFGLLISLSLAAAPALAIDRAEADAIESASVLARIAVAAESACGLQVDHARLVDRVLRTSADFPEFGNWLSGFMWSAEQDVGRMSATELAIYCAAAEGAARGEGLF